MTTRRTLLQALGALAAMPMPAPTFAASGASDSASLLLVLAQDGQHLALVDGENLQVLGRIDCPHALFGRPAFTPDGRHAFFSAQGGWVLRLGLPDLRTTGQARVGDELRAIALGNDGNHLLAGNTSPHSAALLDGSLQTVKAWSARTLDRQRSSPIESIVYVAARNSFVLSLRDIPELWEISLDPKAPPIHDGLVHDYKMGEAIATPGYLGIRRTPLDEPLGELLSGPNPAYVVGATRPRADGSRSADVINLDVRRRITRLPIDGAPHPADGTIFESQGAPALAIPNRTLGLVSVVETRSWQKLADIPIPGPGQRVRSHPALPTLWADASLGGNARNTLTVIDRRTLMPVGQARAPAGHVLGAAELSHDGRHAFAMAPGQQGALLAFDTDSLEPVGRLPIENPSAIWLVPNPRIGAR